MWERAVLLCLTYKHAHLVVFNWNHLVNAFRHSKLISKLSDVSWTHAGEGQVVEQAILDQFQEALCS